MEQTKLPCSTAFIIEPPYTRQSAKHSTLGSTKYSEGEKNKNLLLSPFYNEKPIQGFQNHQDYWTSNLIHENLSISNQTIKFIPISTLLLRLPNPFLHVF